MGKEELNPKIGEIGDVLAQLTKLYSSDEKVPWDQLQRTFESLSKADVNVLIREHATPLARLLIYAGKEHKTEPGLAMLAALRKANLRLSIAKSPVIAALAIVAGPKKEEKEAEDPLAVQATSLCRQLGSVVLTKAALFTINWENWNHLGDLALQALIRLKLPGWDGELHEQLPKIGADLADKEHSTIPSMTSFSAAVATVVGLADQGWDLSDREASIQVIADYVARQSPSQFDSLHPDGIVELTNALVRNAKAKGKGHTVPAASALARALIAQQYYPQYGDWKRNKSVAKALKSLELKVVAAVTFDEILEPPHALSCQLQDDFDLKPGGDTKVGALQAVCELCSENQINRTVKSWIQRILQYLKEAFEATIDVHFQSRLTWPYACLSILGPVVLPDLMNWICVDRICLGITHGGTAAGLIAKCDDATALKHLRVLRDHLLGGNRKARSAAVDIRSELRGKNRSVVWDLMLGYQKEQKNPVHPNLPMVLHSLCGRGNDNTGFDLDNPNAQARVQLALDHLEGTDDDVRYGVICLLRSAMKNVVAREPDCSHHPLAVPVAEALNRTLENHSKQLTEWLSYHEDVYHLTGLKDGLVLFKVVSEHPDHLEARKRLVGACASHNYNLWGYRSIGLNSGLTKYLREAMTGDDPELTECAAGILPKVISAANEVVRTELLSWVEQGLKGDSPEIFLSTIPGIAETCNEQIGPTDWMVDGLCIVDLKPKWRSRSIMRLCEDDPSRFAEVLRSAKSRNEELNVSKLLAATDVRMNGNATMLASVLEACGPEA